jgi:hypothetical protein
MSEQLGLGASEGHVTLGEEGIVVVVILLFFVLSFLLLLLVILIIFSASSSSCHNLFHSEGLRRLSILGFLGGWDNLPFVVLIVDSPP